MYICIYVMILGFLFFIQTFLKLCKALRTEKYKRYINILLLFIIIIIIYSTNTDCFVRDPLHLHI